MRHSLASISPGFIAAAAAAATPLRGMERAEERGRQRGPGPRTHSGAAADTSPASPSAARCLVPDGHGRARTTAVPGPRPALPFFRLRERRGWGVGKGIRTPGRRRPRGRRPPLCARCRRGGGRGGAAAARRRPLPVRSRAVRVRRAAPGLLLRRRGLLLLKEDSAQPNSSLIIPAPISRRRKHPLRWRTLPFLSQPHWSRTAMLVAVKYPEPQVWLSPCSPLRCRPLGPPRLGQAGQRRPASLRTPPSHPLCARPQSGRARSCCRR
ncbi:laforin-like [Lepus europaeus]|uniref:laforin-like n=1 Tax=Lepus europaeus TaxID=9983 RepID=UPI002B46CF59|nr:laforin-like [Lepus europaeus]